MNLSCSSCVYRSSAAVLFFLVVLSSKYTMIFVRVESTVLNLIFSEKKAACVWKLIFVCPRYLGIIGNAENAVLVNIVFPSGWHRVLIFVRYDAYTTALRGLYDVVLPS